MLTGGSGPIGRALVRRLLDAGHQVTAPGRDQLDLRKPESLEAYRGETWDAIIHLATTGSWRGNLAATRALLELDTHRFIYMSSWVVDWAGRAWLRDGYTRGKQACEVAVRASGIASRVIVRPSLVLGDERLVWDRNITRLASCHGIRLSLVPLDQVIDTLVQQALGSTPGLTEIEQYGETVEAASASAVFGGRETVVTRTLAFSVRHLLRHLSTFAFLGERAAPESTAKALQSPGYFAASPPGRQFRPVSAEQLSAMLQCHPTARVLGCGWSRQPMLGGGKPGEQDAGVTISVRRLNHELHFDPLSGNLTVEAGASLNELFDLLDRHDRTVRALPEFRDVSLGSAVMTDIHGSSAQFHVFADQFVSLRLYTDGCWRDGVSVTEARRAGQAAVVGAVELKTTVNKPLLREAMLVPAPVAAADWLGLLRQGEATTLHWYPRKAQVMAWVHREAAAPEGAEVYADGRFLRRYHRAVARLHPPRVWAARGHRLLASWPRLSRLERFALGRSALRNIEFCVPQAEFEAVLCRLREQPPGPVGLRLSPRGIWVDLSTPRPQDYAAWGYPLNNGKWMPAAAPTPHS